MGMVSPIQSVPLTYHGSVMQDTDRRVSICRRGRGLASGPISVCHIDSQSHGRTCAQPTWTWAPAL